MNFSTLANINIKSIKQQMRLERPIFKVIVFVFALAFTLPFKTVESLNFNITDFNDPSASNMAYQGDAKVTNGSIQLNIVNYYFRVGRAIYGQPLHLWDSSSGILTDFSTRFTFTIDKANDSDTTYADGFAFYLAPQGYQIPLNAAGGTFALFNGTFNNALPQNHVVAVEFDTNNGSVDPPMQHVGIDDNSLISVNTAKFDIDENLGKKCHALITYTASNKILTVSWSFNGTSVVPNSKPNTVSSQIDLKKILPEWVDIGFSAATGIAMEYNVIHSWEFSSTLNSSTSKNSTDVTHNGKHDGWKTVVLVAAVTGATVLVVAMVSVAAWVIVKKRRGNFGDNNEKDEHGSTLVKFNLDRETMPRRFDYKELVAATNGFADDRRLGRGGSGQVFKGVLSYLGKVVAVKRIFASFENSERVFINEVRIISRLIHKNLVQFIGWCHEEGELLLVYEYMPNGSLNTHLFGDKKTLAWDVRYKIALGVAVALRYLHEEAEQRVLHRDIKSANVLLDTDFSTKVGDFGMAKLVDPRLRTQTTGVVGTYGYLAPEYINEGRASKESDMYSFGVVALEIGSGRMTYQDGEFHVPLVNWVWQLYVEGNVLDAVDERLNKEFDVDQMRRLLIVGLWCTHPNDKERPNAEEVIKVLKLEAPLPVLPLDMHKDDPPLPSLPSLPSLSLQQPSQSFQSTAISNSLTSVGR